MAPAQVAGTGQVWGQRQTWSRCRRGNGRGAKQVWGEVKGRCGSRWWNRCRAGSGTDVKTGEGTQVLGNTRTEMRDQVRRQVRGQEQRQEMEQVHEQEMEQTSGRCRVGVGGCTTWDRCGSSTETADGTARGQMR